jgi:transposase
MKRYPEDFRDQILKEISEVGNITLVCKKHNLKRTTVMNWLYRSRNKGKITEQKHVRELNKKLKDQEHEILVLRALLKKTYPLWNNEKPLS